MRHKVERKSRLAASRPSTLRAVLQKAGSTAARILTGNAENQSLIFFDFALDISSTYFLSPD